MTLGYTQPLYILPFDHRASYISGMFHLKAPLTEEQHAKVTDSKQLIYEGFKRAIADGVAPSTAGILVDEEFGAPILRDASRSHFITAMSTEQSGLDEFEFEHGEDFARHLDDYKPTFAKALVRYNPEGDAALNARQTARLRQLSEYCAKQRLPFMFELLVPATDAQLAKARNDKAEYDRQIRPGLMRHAIETLQDAGVEPAVWKIEGLDERDDCERVVESARRGGRDTVGCIILGRGADDRKVASWLETAAGVEGFIGFAVGRTSFWDPVADYEAKKIDRSEAAERISKRYREWVDIFERARAA
ncbi:MAG TPA: DUF2090 domain-containing protein [Pararobbsia sp.]|nr:DUF2090 domain-containing protein [Pararobbsia sp.]